ncbi:MAG: hypothetical protein ACD_34C00576G0001 [uncultured bacterium]|nr:MAG: hypothetical protein ACD_34C00576G0001 [uncultured bacterium]
MVGGSKNTKIVFAHGLSSQANIFKYGQVRKDIGNLERSSNAKVRDPMYWKVCNITPHENYLPFSRTEDT